MDIEKVVEMGILIDFYGELLTQKQKDAVNLYYGEDYSLGEISEILKISRQAVYDTLKRAEKILRSYEDKLGLIDRFNLRKDRIHLIEDGLESIEKQIEGNIKSKEAVEEIQKLKETCKELLR